MPQQSHECCIPGLLLQKPAARHEGKAALGEQAVAHGIRMSREKSRDGGWLGRLQELQDLGVADVLAFLSGFQVGAELIECHHDGRPMASGLNSKTRELKRVESEAHHLLPICKGHSRTEGGHHLGVETWALIV